MKVTSGGQTGVDQACLRAARTAGLETGGWAPKGWETEDDPAPWLADFGLVECERTGYSARTFANVKACDLCVLIYAVRQEMSAGTSLTRSACRNHGKELFEVPFYLMGMGDRGGSGNWRPSELRSAALMDTIRRVRPGVLLVAGNRESKAPGLGACAEAFLTEVFQGLRDT